MAGDRIDFARAASDAHQALAALTRAIDLDREVHDLVKLRASQINGCAYCVDRHAREARAAGEDVRRIWSLAAWRETPLYSDRERAALALTETMTLLPAAGVPDEIYRAAAAQFDEEELGQLVTAIVAINAWNRIGVATAMQPPLELRE